MATSALLPPVAMPSSSSPMYDRAARQVSNLRLQMPFQNVAPPLLVSHAHPEPPKPVPSFSGPRGFGARHRLDNAAFTLWDPVNRDFRLPNQFEAHWIRHTFNAKVIEFQWPVMVVATHTPPNPLPLTIAGVAVRFVQPPEPNLHTHPAGPTPLYDPRPIFQANNYLDVRSSVDPLSFNFTKWKSPTDAQLKILVETLVRFCEPRSVSVMCPYIVVELRCDDGRVYAERSLPHKLGGFSAIYHHKPESAFGLLKPRARSIIPTATVQDNTNYNTLNHQLCPGVRVESSIIRDQVGLATATASSTAGVLIRDSHGNQRMTVCNHGFLESRDVYHPTSQGDCIGRITENFEAQDVALVQLYPNLRFSNRSYFASQEPKRLLRFNEIPDGAWFSFDGMSTGLGFLQFTVISLQLPERPPGMTDIRFSKYVCSNAFGTIEGVTEDLREGVCGAPLVSEETIDGGVSGFFHYGGRFWAMSACLDEVIDRGWGIV